MASGRALDLMPESRTNVRPALTALQSPGTPPMHLSPTLPNDPATLADSVRTLARLVHRVKNDPEARKIHRRDLTERIARLQSQLREQPDSRLSRWLKSVQRAIEAA